MSVLINGYVPRGGATWPKVDTLLVTAPTTTVFTVAEAKVAWRVPTPDEDGLVLDFIREATIEVERRTGRKLLTQTWDLVFHGFPRGLALDLGRYLAPVQTITSVTTIDAAGAASIWAAANYHLSGGRLGLATGASWPAALRDFQPVTIRVVAGYASVSAIPDDLRGLVRQIGAHLYRREPPTPDERAAIADVVASYQTVLIA